MKYQSLLRPSSNARKIKLMKQVKRKVLKLVRKLLSDCSPLMLIWGETRGAKRHAPETCNTADLKRDVNSLSKKKRLNETSQSERLKLVARVKSEKLNGHCELKTNKNPELFNSCNSFKLIMAPSEKDSPKEPNHNNLNLASAVKLGLKLEKKNGELDKIESDLKPLRSDHLSLPPLAKIDSKAWGEFSVESKNNSLRKK
ncbi:hypothetical protein QYM36_013163 [Artemia franciscana]|uniref:Uncharacterized protein n=1 Tax=Artemia franciscana TaxID=6661 RepID=A0AA88HCB4_ARTSF|nr:hypothetical protein QYM36_013163 [Artemia franciscana]